MGIKELLKRDITQQELLNYFNASIDYVKLPSKIDGCVFFYKGIYIIFIKEALSYYKKKKTILHELAHIELAQLEGNDKDLFATYIDKYEDEANEYLEKVLNEIKESI